VQANGLPFLGSGQHFFVGATTAANRDMVLELFGYHADPDGDLRFFDTIEEAIGACTANAGDMIYVLPGYTQTISAASGIDIDVAGVSLIGLGLGGDRPVITFDTATTADLDIGASGIYIKNFEFVNDIDALAEPIDIEANVEDVTFDECLFLDDTASKQTVRWFQTADTNSGIKFLNCKHYGSDTAGATAWGTFIGGLEHVVDGLVSHGDMSAANIEIKTTLTAELIVKNCLLENANAVDVNIEGNSLSNTGWLANNYCRIATDGQTTWINNIGNASLFENYGVNNNGETGVLIGTASS